MEPKQTTAAYGSYFADFKQMEEFQSGRLRLKDADLDLPLREVRALLPEPGDTGWNAVFVQDASVIVTTIRVDASGTAQWSSANTFERCVTALRFAPVRIAAIGELWASGVF